VTAVLAIDQGTSASKAAVFDRREWIDDPRYATNAERTRNRETLLPMIVEIVGRKTAQEWTELLEQAGVPCAPIHSVPQVVEHEQTRAIGMLLDSQNEQLKIMGLPLSLDGQRPGYGARAPTLGEHQDMALAK